MNDLLSKQKALESCLKKFNTLAVAFSGGVDSTYLLAAAKSVFQDNDRLIAVTAVSPVHPPQDIKGAELFARDNNIRHLVVQTPEMESEAFLKNPSNRCYVCKKIIFETIFEKVRNYSMDAVAHGVNADDCRDYRPGIKAAEEMNIAAPLLTAGLTKNDIRQLSREMGLPTWNKPSSGCLATRIPYGEPITLQKLKMVEAAEKLLSGLGFTTSRVRNYGETAKLEVLPQEIERLLDPIVRSRIIHELKKIGFLYITIDIEGYQSGRLNRSVISNTEAD